MSYLETQESPIRMEVKKAVGGSKPIVVGLFNMYSFERSVVTPAAAFRLTAPALERAQRFEIRSGDTVTLSVKNQAGTLVPILTGFVDETDTHVLPNSVEFSVTGRDTLGQLVDNTAVDGENRVINSQDISLQTLAQLLVKNTRIPKTIIFQQLQNVPNLIVQSNAGETKVNLLQRYLDLCNCLCWTKPNGQVVIGKPTFTGSPRGRFILSSTDPSSSNVLEARVRRNLNLAIRKIVAQLTTFGQVDPAPFTQVNADDDMREVRAGLVGRSVYMPFSYSQGGEAANQARAIGNQSLNPTSYGRNLALRELAKDNMKVLDVEVVVPGHVNDLGQPYDVDQLYEVQIEDDAVSEVMFVYSVSYEMTLEHGTLTRLKLCKRNTIVSGGDALPRKP